MIRQLVLVAVSLLCLTGCGEIPKSVPPRVALEEKPAEDAQPPGPPIPLTPAPKGQASLSFLSGADARCALGGRHVSGNAAPSEPNREEIEAKPLQVGLIAFGVSRSLVNQMTEKTRVWKIDSPSFDFYKILSGGQANGLRPDKPSIACIRYAMGGVDDAAPSSEMIFSVTYDPATPEIVTVAPVRIHYRDFATLSAGSGTSQAVVKAALSLKTYSVERNSGRQAISLQNEEMAVEIFDNPGSGKALDQHYDRTTVPAAKIPLPPWDYSSAYDNPRHNLSFLELMVTEIADFDWLQSQIRVLWPSWEYEATDVSKLKLSAQSFSRGHSREP